VQGTSPDIELHTTYTAGARLGFATGEVAPTIFRYPPPPAVSVCYNGTCRESSSGPSPNFTAPAVLMSEIRLFPRFVLREGKYMKWKHILFCVDCKHFVVQPVGRMNTINFIIQTGWISLSAECLYFTAVNRQL
jgi:hypothetical protein